MRVEVEESIGLPVAYDRRDRAVVKSKTKSFELFAARPLDCCNSQFAQSFQLCCFEVLETWPHQDFGHKRAVWVVLDQVTALDAFKCEFVLANVLVQMKQALSQLAVQTLQLGNHHLLSKCKSLLLLSVLLNCVLLDASDLDGVDHSALSCVKHLAFLDSSEVLF